MDTLTQTLKRLTKPAIRLKFTGEPPSTPGASRFGGAPDVPADFNWPRFTTNTYDDEEVKPRPLAFLAQFDCARFAPLDPDGLLPHAGLLSFFYELGSQRWGFDPADRGSARAFWFKDGAALSPAPFPEDLEEDFRLPAIGVAMTEETSWPDYEDLAAIMKVREPASDFFDAYMAARRELGLEDSGNRSKLLGWPDLIQGNACFDCEMAARGFYLGGDRDVPPPQVRQEVWESAVESWQLLFQLDTVERDDFQLMFGDCGRVYFYVRKDDLRAGQFDRVWLVLQCG